MREIKFRGKRDDGDWIYGYLVIDPRGNYRIYFQPFDEATSNTYYFVIPETVGQFTEAKDKNDVEIYFGDRLRFADKWEWYKGIWAWKLMGKVGDEREALIKEYDALPFEERVVEDIRDYEWLLSSEIKTYWEVIGNIHDK